MYRPWWFPEYSAREQVVFDSFADILRKHFTQRNYVHIQTPAVEPVDILSRGGDVFDKQVYGLYGLAQWVEERKKRGRYKEFRQFDIDTIWPAQQEGGVWYDAESIIVMTKALQEVFQSMKVDGTIIVKLSNIRLIKSLLASRNTTSDIAKQVFKILDDRYKRSWEENISLLNACLSTDQTTFIKTVVGTGDLSLLDEYDGYTDTKKIGEYLTAFGIEREFALPIVRWHGYYTGMVAELFIAEDMSLGAIAGGWRQRPVRFASAENWVVVLCLSRLGFSSDDVDYHDDDERLFQQNRHLHRYHAAKERQKYNLRGDVQPKGRRKGLLAVGCLLPGP